MKHLLKSIFAIAVLLSATTTFAQSKSPQERAYAQSQWMKEHLALTPQQNSKVFGIIFKYTKEADKIAPGTNNKSLQDIQANKDNEIKAVISADQFTKYQASKKEMSAATGN